MQWSVIVFATGLSGSISASLRSVRSVNTSEAAAALCEVTDPINNQDTCTQYLHAVHTVLTREVLVNIAPTISDPLCDSQASQT